MIVAAGQEIVDMVAGGVSCIAVYKGSNLVWQPASSCFGDGGWRNDRGWANNEGWNNG